MDLNMNMLAYCGIYCEQCSARTAFIERDGRHLEDFPGKYKRNDLAEYDCEGCKGRNICGPCDLKECAGGKGVDSCAECADFPCAIISDFGNDGIPHHGQAFENLHTIREHGVDAWFKTLQPALRCHCGQRQSWYFHCPEHA